MMAIMAGWAKGLSGLLPRLSVATIDHGLRSESVKEAKEVARLAGALGLRHVVLSWQGDKPTTGIQEAAREARYALLKAHADAIKADAIMLAHHADDQAETVLMRLCAGSGLAGLAGMSRVMKWQNIDLIRPFLTLPSARLRATALAAGMVPIDDPSNENPKFTRVRLRQARDVLALEGLSALRLGRLALRMRRADAALERVTDLAFNVHQLAAESGFRFAAQLLDEPDEIVLRVVQRALRSLGVGKAVDLANLEAIIEALVDAHLKGQKARRTLAGALVSIDANGVVTIGVEGVRRHFVQT